MNINVTKPFLPPISEYTKILEGIWNRNWLTNDGPVLNELELRLKDYLETNHLLITSNGTIALQIAIKALDIKGEIITTPFTYVATTSSIVWEGCTPVMVDIDENTLNIDHRKIEAAINHNTKAILATHVFGNACNIDAIDHIANKYKLKVIYDAAHCFGTKYKGRSIFRYGDISTCSFHSTKLFHTIEGGGLFSESPELIRKMALLRNFGHISPTQFGSVGINGKNSEFHAAMGLCNIKRVDEFIIERCNLKERYMGYLSNIESIRFPGITPNCKLNNAYFPVILESENVLLNVLSRLNEHDIYPRRYFYPSLDELDYISVKYDVPVSTDISKRILCLPFYNGLSLEEIDLVCRILIRTLKYG
jgi:dTDP-4-amino-4,6-dideoxygalactose transaminase